MMKTRILQLITISWLVLLANTMCQAQKYLQIEKRNSLKVVRFIEGDVIQYKLKGKAEMWKTEQIDKIYVDQNALMMPNGLVKIDDIKTMRRERPWTKAYQTSMYTFGLGWAFWNGVGTLIKEDKFTKSDAVVIGTALSTGFLVRKLFKFKHFKMEKKHRLRLIDLNFREQKY